MGVVIRPEIFIRQVMPATSIPKSHPRRIDFRFFAVLMAMAVFAWILALAGAVFTVRVMLIICAAAMAGQPHRVRVPARAR